MKYVSALLSSVTATGIKLGTYDNNAHDLVIKSGLIIMLLYKTAFGGTTKAIFNTYMS